MSRFTILIAVLALIGIGVFGCSDDATGPAPSSGGNANQAPGQPTNNTAGGSPADGGTDLPISQTLRWSCTDPDGDVLTYDVHFGTAATPPSVSTDQSDAYYSTGTLSYSTTYYWNVVAKDPSGATASSATFDFTTMAQPGEVVSTPNTPTGSAAIETNALTWYTTGGSTSDAGHAVEYRFDWDDGPMSDWAAATTVSHTWSTAGTYEVKAQARCTIHTGVESAWSVHLQVVVSDPGEIIYGPSPPTGPLTGVIDEDATFTTTGATSNLGHDLEYQFDWDDGTQSVWSASRSATHQWTSADDYGVTVRARCAVHTSVVTDPSTSRPITITDAAETVSTPNQPSGQSSVTQNTRMSLQGGGAVSSHGHPVEYHFDWGDGHISEWVDNSTLRRAYHAYSSTGVFEAKAQARCSIDTLVVSGWSATKSITVEEYITTVGRPTGPATGEINQALTYSTTGATSSDGHALEYRFGRYLNSSGGYTWNDWSSSTTQDLVFPEAGNWYVYVQARCATHTDITNQSGYMRTTITAP